MTPGQELTNPDDTNRDMIGANSRMIGKLELLEMGIYEDANANTYRI